MPVIFELDIGEGDVADGSVDRGLGQACILEVFDADVVVGMLCAGDLPRYMILLDANEAPTDLPLHEVARPAAGLQNRCILGDTETINCFVHGFDYRG